MNLRNCTLDDNLCLTCPEIDPVSALPATHVTTPNLGWNAGANSVTALAGDVHTVFGVPESENGVMVGLRRASDARPPVAPAFITHGLYFFNTRGAYVIPIENGVQQGSPVAYAVDDIFEVRRVGGRVSYYQNTTLLRQSTLPSTGAVRVMTCLYAAGDNVP